MRKPKRHPHLDSKRKVRGKGTGRCTKGDQLQRREKKDHKGIAEGRNEEARQTPRRSKRMRRRGS